MDQNLPNIDIVEDIESIMDDEPTPQKVQMTIDEVEQAEVEESPFVQPEVKPPTKESIQGSEEEAPKKKKKPLSEKQKAHLERIRKLANQRRAEKAAAKKEALKKVESEHQAKTKYKKRTKKIDDTEPREQEQNDAKKSTPDDFVPSHKAKIEEKKTQREEKAKYEFGDFMKHMEQYQFMKYVYDEEQKKKAPKQKPVAKQAPPKPKAQPVSLVPPKPKDPYDDYFG
tara:strand:+ start:1104 stop:1784 length:681 start_codon:yes stop_codon:yes gene_type:complete